MKHKINLSIVFILFSIVALWLLANLHLNYRTKNYDRAVYSVVIYNNTNENLKDISIFYGNDHPEHYTLKKFSALDNINVGEFTKVNISTKSFPIPPPYNIYIQCKDEEFICVGYAGINTGGFEVVKIDEDDNQNISVKRLSTSNNLYKKLKRRHYKNQTEKSWY